MRRTAAQLANMAKQGSLEESSSLPDNPTGWWQKTDSQQKRTEALTDLSHQHGTAPDDRLYPHATALTIADSRSEAVEGRRPQFVTA